jgi:hypothetical protein
LGFLRFEFFVGSLAASYPILAFSTLIFNNLAKDFRLEFDQQPSEAKNGTLKNVSKNR